MKRYFAKMSGTTRVGPPRVGHREIMWSWVGGFVGISALALLSEHFFDPRDLPLLIGSFGASAVLAYGAIRSPLAQPRNLVGGHVVSALIGVTCWKLFPDVQWLAESLAVASAIAAMHFTRTLHPPGGATALIAVVGSPQIHHLGYLYVLVPAGLGSAILLLVALFVNNIPGSRRYPELWF